MTLDWGKPNAKQELFLTAKTKYIAYGGARGGGKSWAVRVKAALMCIYGRSKEDKKGIKVLILRRTYQELYENHIVLLQQMLNGIATYNDSKKVFSFKNGSRLRIGYCANNADLLQYQGQEFDVIFIDEATQFQEEQFRTLLACLRGTYPYNRRVYLTCNPGGIGHQWIKRLFVDRQFKEDEGPEDYLFIPATVYDNHALDGSEYIKFLESLPDNRREAWLNGNWDVYDGQYFSEFNRAIHVCDIPRDMTGWARYVSLDYGLDMLACYWIAVDPIGQAIVYKELYQSDLIVSDAAKRILEVTGTDHIDLWIAPPDLWNRNRDTGESTADIFAAHGIALYKSSNDRVQGWYALKEWLKTDNPLLKIGKNCTELIRCLPLLQYDDKNPNDIATEPHEITHAPDALRYFVAARPMPAVIKQEYDEDYVEIDTQIDSLLEYGR